jgi:uncharacterized protein involved in copper resistance
MRDPLTAFAFLVSSLICLHASASQTDAQGHSAHDQMNHEDMDHADMHHAERPKVIERCTQGSFIGAINSMHAATKALGQIAKTKGDAARSVEAELVSILKIAAERADAESSCAKTLEFGYDEHYRKVVLIAKTQLRAHRQDPKHCDRLLQRLAVLSAGTSQK